jgi:hypothetical protein
MMMMNCLHKQNAHMFCRVCFDVFCGREYTNISNFDDAKRIKISLKCEMNPETGAQMGLKRLTGAL